MKMASFQTLFIAIFISAFAFQTCLGEGKFSKSMYFNWGAQHSSFLGNGDEVQLVLDRTSGIHTCLCPYVCACVYNVCDYHLI